MIITQHLLSGRFCGSCGILSRRSSFRCITPAIPSSQRSGVSEIQEDCITSQVLEASGNFSSDCSAEIHGKQDLDKRQVGLV